GHKDARVHCVVLKIRAEPHHTPAPTTPQQQEQRYDQQARPALKSRAKKARALRTQQRAKHHPPSAPLSTTPPPKERNQYSQPPPHGRCQLIDVPPLSNPHDTDGHERATWTPCRPPATMDQEPRCQCSLERR